MAFSLNNFNYTKTLAITRAFILSNNGTFVDVEDTLQEGLKIFFENLQKKDFVLTTTPENYIYQVCIKLWYKEIRRRSIEKNLNIEIHSESLSQQEDIEIVIRREKLLCILERNIKKLHPRGRELYTLKFKGLSLKEIAARMGLKNSSIAKDKCYREKRRLIELIKQDPEYQNILHNEQEAGIIDKIF